MTASSYRPNLAELSSVLIITSYSVAKVVVEDPDELEKIRDREAKITKDRIELILNSGANVILTVKGIDDYSLKFLVEKGAAPFYCLCFTSAASSLLSVCLLLLRSSRLVASILFACVPLALANLIRCIH